MMRLAIISHVVPPSPSGQAMVLLKLLNGFPSDTYFLISCRNYNGNQNNVLGSETLSARYYYLRRVFQLPIVISPELSVFNIAFNALVGIYARAAQIERIVRKERCDLLIACTGDLCLLPAAYLTSKRAGIPFVPFIFDDYAYQWTGVYRFISKRLEPIILKHSKGVLVTNEFMQTEYMHRYGVSSTVIHNPCSIPKLRELDKAEKAFNLHEVNIVYTGAIYHAHYDAFRNLIAAIRRLKEFDTKLHLYTFQPESELRQNGISGDMVVYHPHMNNSEVPKVLRQSDVLFLPLAFDSSIPEVIRTSAPGKTGEYLSVGKPVLVHAPRDSFVSWFFKKNHCGVVVDRNDPQILSEGLSQLITNTEMHREITRNARRIAASEFNIDKMKNRFTEFVKTLQEEQ